MMEYFVVDGKGDPLGFLQASKFVGFGLTVPVKSDLKLSAHSSDEVDLSKAVEIRCAVFKRGVMASRRIGGEPVRADILVAVNEIWIELPRAQFETIAERYASKSEAVG